MILQDLKQENNGLATINKVRKNIADKMKGAKRDSSGMAIHSRS